MEKKIVQINLEEKKRENLSPILFRQQVVLTCLVNSFMHSTKP